MPRVRAVALGAEEARALGHPFLGTKHVLLACSRKLTGRRQAEALGYDCADTEHLLLALVQVKGALAARILADLGASEERVRAHLASVLGVDAAVLVASVGRRRRRLRRLARNA